MPTEAYKIVYILKLYFTILQGILRIKSEHSVNMPCNGSLVQEVGEGSSYLIMMLVWS